jgi:hypothetical protein
MSAIAGPTAAQATLPIGGFPGIPKQETQKTPKQPEWKTAFNWHDGPGQASRPPEVGPLGQA